MSKKITTIIKIEDENGTVITRTLAEDSDFVACFLGKDSKNEMLEAEGICSGSGKIAVVGSINKLMIEGWAKSVAEELFRIADTTGEIDIAYDFNSAFGEAFVENSHKNKEKSKEKLIEEMVANGMDEATARSEVEDIEGFIKSMLEAEFNNTDEE